MNKRIKEVRKNAKMNQTEFGAAIGATQKMITTYETGVVVPDKTTRMLICSKFKVNQTWLETGEGDPYNEGLVPSLTYALMRMPSVCDALERILPLLTDDDLAKLDELAGIIKDKFGKK